jgi:hypothetical protein
MAKSVTVEEVAREVRKAIIMMKGLSVEDDGIEISRSTLDEINAIMYAAGSEGMTEDELVEAVLQQRFPDLVQ